MLNQALSLSKAKTRSEGEDIFFQGETSPFSNFFPAEISDAGMTFESAEQVYQYRRARAHGRKALAKIIMSTRVPYRAKQLGRKIQDSSEWKQTSEDVMLEILMAKFTQNTGLGQLLISTSGSQLHEATSDKKWAVGTDLSSKALTNEEWKGGDLLGQLLEATRDHLIAKLGGDNGVYPSDTTQSGDPYNDQHTPLSDDDASDCFEECLQDEREELESSPSLPSSPSHQSQELPTEQQASDPTPSQQGDKSQPITEIAQSKSALNINSQPATPLAPRGNSRNPFRSQSRSNLATPVQTSEPSSSVQDISQNVSTRASRNRKKKNWSKSQPQISETIPKQLC